MYKSYKLGNFVLPLNSFFILLFCLLFNTSVSGDARSELNDLTGGIHTRVAWREGGDQIRGGSQIIKGFDSETGEIHTIWSDGAVKSVLCAGGNKLLLTSDNYNVWVVDWDGNNKKQLAEGSVSDGWQDPETGKDWAIYRASGTGTGGGIYRVLIEDPEQKELIYDGSEGHSVYPWFQISADGSKAASFFPYSDGGFFDINTGDVSLITNGCWSGMASDNSYNWFHLAGSHQSLIAFNRTEQIGSFNAMPPISGEQIYCPRPAEGPEEGGLFFALSGGYPGYNQNGDNVEIFVGKLNNSYNSVVGWARITDNNEPDHHPTVWIGVESTSSSSILISPDSLIFNATVEQATIDTKTVAVTSTGNPLENVSAESDQSWLNVRAEHTDNGWQIENEPNISGLSVGVHHASVTITASNAVPSSKTYQVEMTVEEFTSVNSETIKKSLNPLSIRRNNPRTIVLQLNQKGSFEVEILTPKGVMIESFAVNGPSDIRWAAEAAGLYVVRIKSQRGKFEEKVFMW